LPLLNSMNDSLAHNIVPFVDELLPILTDPILTIYFDQFWNSDAENFEFFFWTRYILGSQKFENGFQGKQHHQHLMKKEPRLSVWKTGVCSLGSWQSLNRGWLFRYLESITVALHGSSFLTPAPVAMNNRPHWKDCVAGPIKYGFRLRLYACGDLCGQNRFCDPGRFGVLCPIFFPISF